MWSVGTLLALLLVTVVPAFWAAPLSAGCPADVPYPDDSYELSETHPTIYLESVLESSSGVWFLLVNVTHECIWLVNGHQPSAEEPYIHTHSSSLLLEPFEQNISNTTIKCLGGTKTYMVIIGEVYVCAGLSPSSTAGPAATPNFGSDHFIPLSDPPAISPMGTALQTTPPSGHSITTAKATSNVTPTNPPSNEDPPNNAVIFSVLGTLAFIAATGVITTIIIVCGYRYIYRRNHRHDRGHGGAAVICGGGVTGSCDASGGEKETDDKEMQAVIIEEPVQESKEAQSVTKSVVCSRSCDIIVEESSTCSGGRDETNSAVSVLSEGRLPIPETQEPLDGIPPRARPPSELQKSLQERGYRMTPNTLLILKSFVIQQEDPLVPSIPTSGYDQLYDDADGVEEENKITRSPHGRTTPISLPLCPSPTIIPLPSSPHSPLLPPPPSSQCSSTSSMCSSSGDSGVDMADGNTEDASCTENGGWEEAAQLADGVEETTMEGMIPGHEMNQEFHREEDNDEIEGGYTTLPRKRLLGRAKGGHTRKKDRLVGVALTLGNSPCVTYMPPSKWKPLPFTSNVLNVEMELVHGTMQISTSNHSLCF